MIVKSFHLSGHTFSFRLQEIELPSVITQTIPLLWSSRAFIWVVTWVTPLGFAWQISPLVLVELAIGGKTVQPILQGLEGTVAPKPQVLPGSVHYWTFMQYFFSNCLSSRNRFPGSSWWFIDGRIRLFIAWTRNEREFQKRGNCLEIWLPYANFIFTDS